MGWIKSQSGQTSEVKLRATREVRTPWVELEVKVQRRELTSGEAGDPQLRAQNKISQKPAPAGHEEQNSGCGRTPCRQDSCFHVPCWSRFKGLIKPELKEV